MPNCMTEIGNIQPLALCRSGVSPTSMNTSPRRWSIAFPEVFVMKDAVIIEVRAAEGGDDAKLLVVEQVKIYFRLCGRRGL